jgi:hypothetical protein
MFDVTAPSLAFGVETCDCCSPVRILHAESVALNRQTHGWPRAFVLRSPVLVSTCATRCVGLGRVLRGSLVYMMYRRAMGGYLWIL